MLPARVFDIALAAMSGLTGAGPTGGPLGLSRCKASAGPAPPRQLRSHAGPARRAGLGWLGWAGLAGFGLAWVWLASLRLRLDSGLDFGWILASA